MPGQDLELARSIPSEAAVVAKRYAGFVGAEDLTPQEQLISIVSLVPMALEVVEEARDTIERLNDENEALRAQVAALTQDANDPHGSSRDARTGDTAATG